MSPKDRRAILLGGVILVPALLFIYVVRPYRTTLADTRDAIELERIALSRELAAVRNAKIDPTGQRAADSAVRLAAPRLFEGRDDAFASAQLAAYLGMIAKRSRMLLQDANTRPAEVLPEGIRTLRVELRAESDVQGVTTFLHNLEGGDKLVRVDRLEISRVPGLEDRNGFETLSIAATVSGFAFAPSSADASDTTKRGGKAK
jgi:hypothetical protein